MKLLWICNKKIKLVSKILGESIDPLGGWLDSACESLIDDENNQFYVMFPDKKNIHCKAENFECFSFTQQNTFERFVNIIDTVSPDIIHIWGTEFSHSLQAINAAEILGYLNKCVVSIQGAVHIYGKYHYTEGLPFNVIYRFTLRDFFKKNNIYFAKQALIKRGEDEKKCISKCKHIIGRTDWDRAIVSFLNKDATYYLCNESLRNSFYEKKWNEKNIKKHSIFVSQCNYPIKGFHYVLEAMPMILKQYPDAHIYTTGIDLNNLSLASRLKITSYQKYICSLIKKYNLKNHITFLGILSEEKMCEQYLNANVFVSASTIENSPNSVGEAMLVGCPVVSSDVGGVKNLLNHEIDGYLFQTSAPYMLAFYICQIFCNEYLANKFSVNARKHALKTHSRENNFQALINIYNLINKGCN